ncbi:MAG: ATP-binding cassette domain-containing protein, partial [Actinomycetota bacterium]|nr:ATP-binding cassette domain-containing protein [Actinomycetota bacterium]
STVARAVAGLERVAAGRIRFEGVGLTALRGSARRRARRALHLVFQDPYASLPPTLPVGRIVAEPLVIHCLGDREVRVHDALGAVHLPPGRYLHRYPHQLSGGERQRVAFARALVTEPRLVLADEPTQMLDASLRAEIADLLEELRARRGVAVLHITHDLALAQRSCDRLVVLRAGRVVEQGQTDAVLARPEHSYTRALIDAARALHRRPV